MNRRSLRLALMVTIAASLSACVFHKHHPKDTQAPARITSIGVNAYLWRAALDTVSFMPLVQTDSNGGVIVTDWYANPAVPAERVKVTVSILDQDLRADAVRVAVQRQINRNGEWVGAPVEAATSQRMEDLILTRARDLRRAASIK
ncbi:DUF3576 domain-containing protein [Sphingomonas sp. GlSt437]|uniref:DUF3576 domain-containing protein n=1 Tax=Sphingomonas sp. GlSt437 TaxID=3389970 RepID=UPI003A8B41D9